MSGAISTGAARLAIIAAVSHQILLIALIFSENRFWLLRGTQSSEWAIGPPWLDYVRLLSLVSALSYAGFHS